MDVKLLYIDLFCGAGGTSTGVEKARINNQQCAKVIACVNHDKNAIASHASNHPDALHFTEDIRTLELSPLKSHLDNCKNNTQTLWLCCGLHWNAPTLVRQKEDSHEMLTAEHWQSICSDISKRLTRISFRLKMWKNL